MKIHVYIHSFGPGQLGQDVAEYFASHIWLTTLLDLDDNLMLIIIQWNINVCDLWDTTTNMYITIIKIKRVMRLTAATTLLCRVRMLMYSLRVHLDIQGLYSLRQHRHISTGIVVINMRRSSDRLRLIIQVTIPIRRCLFRDMAKFYAVTITDRSLIGRQLYRPRSHKFCSGRLAAQGPRWS